MKIKTRTDILHDIILDAKKHPRGWKASFGYDSKLYSNDCYIFHPNIGIYLLKEYHKNPYEIQGVGTKIARHIDDDIEEQLERQGGDFGIIQGDIQKILKNMHRGIPPQQIIQGAIKGKDYGIKIPVRGHASTLKETYEYLHHSFSTKQKKLSSTFEKIMADDGAYTSYE